MDEDIIARVREIITASGESQRVVAGRIGIDAPKLTKSLKGERRFTSYELAAIAELGGRTMEWLLSGTGERTYTFAYRTLTSERDIAHAAGREMVSLIADRFDVAVELDFAPQVMPLPTAPKTRSYIQTAQRFAGVAVDAVRAPIYDLDNLDLIGVLESRFGINVAVEQLPEGIDGLSFLDGDLRVIVAAATLNASRQRFTLAHEFAHVVLGDASGEVIEEDVTIRGDGNQEARANTFAAAFLMPQDEVAAVLSGRDPASSFNELAWRFRVAPDSLAWRLFNLGLIDEVTRRRLSQRSAKTVATALGLLDEHLARSQQAAVVRPAGRLSRAYLGAFFAGDVAAGPVAEINGITEDAVYELRAQIDLPAEWPDLFESE